MQKWTMFALFCAACVLGLSVLFSTIPDENVAEEEAPIVSEAPLNVAAAEAVYKKSCIACHGDQLQGGAGPGLATVGAEMDEQQLIKKIQNGGSVMPKFKGTLSDDEIGNLAKWLSEKK